MPGDVALVDLYYGKGIDNAKDFIISAVELGVVGKKGSFLSYGDIKGNGPANFLAAVREANVYDKIEKETREAMLSENKIIPPIEIDEDDHLEDDHLEDDNGYDEDDQS